MGQDLIRVEDPDVVTRATASSAGISTSRCPPTSGRQLRIGVDTGATSIDVVTVEAGATTTPKTRPRSPTRPRASSTAPARSSPNAPSPFRGVPPEGTARPVRK